MRQKSGIDFLLLDEVLDLSLDETGQEALVALLGELARDVSSIFVISHKQFIKEHFNKNLVVVKKKGESRIL
jgi:DNA repair exonuclease SbcCD ATPase subunit